MTLFNFKSLVNAYMTGHVVVIQDKGYYDETSGDYIEDNEDIELELFAIVPLSRDELRFDSGGTYNHDSRKLYCYRRLNKADKVINTMDDGSTRSYKILSIEDYSDFDKGLCICYLERTDRDDEP